MRTRCPHCRHELEVTISALGAEARPSLVEPPAPAPKSPKGHCACGHERAMHDDGGAGRCHYGRGHALGGCSCDGFHSRARRTLVNGSNGHASAATRDLSPCARACLTVLVQRRGKATTRKQLAVMSGYSVSSGSFAQALAHLRIGGLIDGDASALRPVLPTATQALGSFEDLPRGSALLDYWAKRVGPCASAILQRVVTEHPEPVDRAELAETTGYSASSGSFAAALAELRALALLDGFRASDELMSSLRDGAVS
jgi:hypothetical protein